MKFYFLFLIVYIFNNQTIAQKTKFDSTLKIGKVGYRITCANKSNEKNELNLSLIGFEENRSDINLNIKGKIQSAEIDDLNRDGFPDLLIYIFSEGEKRKGTVLAISSDNNKSIAPIVFPDITDDAKLSAGYTGGDEYKLFNGILLRKFPVLIVADSSATSVPPVKVIRQIIYKVVMGERGTLKFKVERSFDANKPS